jgi:hypothetical protein
MHGPQQQDNGVGRSMRGVLLVAESSENVDVGGKQGDLPCSTNREVATGIFQPCQNLTIQHSRISQPLAGNHEIHASQLQHP